MPEPLTMVMVGAGGGGLLLQLARRQFHLFKEVLDLVGGAFLLAAFAPVMLLCALIIKIADVVFRLANGRARRNLRDHHQQDRRNESDHLLAAALAEGFFGPKVPDSAAINC